MFHKCKINNKEKEEEEEKNEIFVSVFHDSAIIVVLTAKLQHNEILFTKNACSWPQLWLMEKELLGITYEAYKYIENTMTDRLAARIPSAA